MKTLISLLLLASLLFNPSSVSAHLRGIPIAKINGVDTKVYPVQDVRTGVFNLPDDADAASENYLVNQELSFSVDTSKLPTPQEIWAKTDLIWDFGDGSRKQTLKNGTTNTHIYTKIGTHIMTITADYKTAGFDLEPQVIQTTVINILADKNYQLPKAIITVNGQKSPSTKSLSFDFVKPLVFDGSNAISPSSEIIAYEWDFEDGERSKQKIAAHGYTLPRNYATVLLRVTDANGFFTDEYITLANNGKNDPKEGTGRFFLVMLGAIATTVLIFSVGALVIKKMKKRRRK